MVEIVNNYSGKTETVYGLAGLGDIYVSVSGGRNSNKINITTRDRFI